MLKVMKKQNDKSTKMFYICFRKGDSTWGNFRTETKNSYLRKENRLEAKLEMVFALRRINKQMRFVKQLITTWHKSWIFCSWLKHFLYYQNMHFAIHFILLLFCSAWNHSVFPYVEALIQIFHRFILVSWLFDIFELITIAVFW